MRRNIKKLCQGIVNLLLLILFLTAGNSVIDAMFGSHLLLGSVLKAIFWVFIIFVFVMGYYFEENNNENGDEE